MADLTRLLVTEQAAMLARNGADLTLREARGFGIEAAEDDFWGGVGRLLAAIELALPEASEYHREKAARVQETFEVEHAKRLGLTEDGG